MSSPRSMSGSLTADADMDKERESESRLEENEEQSPLDSADEFDKDEDMNEDNEDEDKQTVDDDDEKRTGDSGSGARESRMSLEMEREEMAATAATDDEKQEVGSEASNNEDADSHSTCSSDQVFEKETSQLKDSVKTSASKTTVVSTTTTTSEATKGETTAKTVTTTTTKTSAATSSSTTTTTTTTVNNSGKEKTLQPLKVHHGKASGSQESEESESETEDEAKEAQAAQAPLAEAETSGIVIPVPVRTSETEVDDSQMTTLQLVLRAREIAAARKRKEEEEAAAIAAAAAAAAEAAAGVPAPMPRYKLRLPHLREPTKEPEPTDPDFTVRLGAFMERTGDDSLPRLLQKEFPEPDHLTPRLLERSRSRLMSTPTSPLSPITPLSPVFSPAATPREIRWSNSSHGGIGVMPRRASLTLRRRREESQILKGPDYLAPVPGQYITESESGFARFRRVAKMVRIGVQVCAALRSFVERNNTEGWSFVEMYLHVQQDMRQDLAFNIHAFSKSQPMNGGPKLEKLLSTPPEHRTATIVQQILTIVRSHNGFNDFPVHVQIQMCRAMRYERYDSRRILLRQGHTPTTFYLLLTGNLMVNIRDVHPSTGHVFIRTVSDLKEGDCFGELALLEVSPRTATIICKNAVELLCIARDDFDRIIRFPLLRQRDNIISMCRNHLLFEDYPVDVFYDNPEGFFFQYCPAGMVVVKNGQRCAYLVFVKSGKCHLVGSYNSSELTRKRLESASRDVQRAFPLYTEVLKMASTGRQRPGTHPERRGGNENMEMDLLTQVLGIRHSQLAAQAKRDLGVRTQDYVPPPPPPLRKSRTLTNFYDKLQKERRQKLLRSSDPGTEAVTSFWAQRLQGPVLRKPGKSGRVKADRRLPNTPTSGQNVRSLDFLRPDREGFAQIAELSEGDVFGLETLVRRQASRVSVVSDGAELVFISKKLFLQHANIRVLRIVHDMSIMYPSAVSIHSKLKYQREWTRYKHALVRHVVTRMGRAYEPPCQAWTVSMHGDLREL